MKQEYLFNGQQHRNSVNDYQPAGVTIQFRELTDDSWIVTYSISGENEESSKKLSAVDKKVKEEFKGITLENGSSEYFNKGIKVLSLFFIDKVDHYRLYDEKGKPQNGVYATMFEEEYQDVVDNLQLAIGDEAYIQYLDRIAPTTTHAGYFSIDKKGRMIDSKLGDKKEKTSDDVDAYDLIMKNKELLLDRNPKRSPVRFIFSHSALREGWDNPNVFQICTLKQSGSEIRKRQEVGRGLRLCVNQDGERMDSAVLGDDVHNLNVLTVIASESYESFAKSLQMEMAEVVADRPREVTRALFENKIIKDSNGNEQHIDSELADAIWFSLYDNRYIDRKGNLSDKYYHDKRNNCLQIADEVKDFVDDIAAIIDTVFDAKAFKPENARANNVELHLEEDKKNLPEFQELWNRINAKSVYTVNFDNDKLIDEAITALNTNLHIPRIFFYVETGEMTHIESKEALQSGTAFVKKAKTPGADVKMASSSNAKYDLVGRIAKETKLTRKAVVSILTGIEKPVFDQFKNNPEEFIVKAGQIINEQKVRFIVQHITYHVLDDTYSSNIFTDSHIKGKMGVNVMKAEKHLYDYIVYDSDVERDFASELDVDTNVAVYVKLPSAFFISTPVGKYNPDWAIAFYEGSVKHVYFVAETKSTMSPSKRRGEENDKIACAMKHFEALSTDRVMYHVVDSYQKLIDLVRN